MKKTCVVYGNCQAAVIRAFLSRHHIFSKEYDLVELKPVHLLGKADISYLEEVIACTDLFIHQPISRNYKGLPSLSTHSLCQKVKDNCQVISFPVAYFTGYNPEITYLQDSNGLVQNRSLPYHDFNILSLYSQGKSLDETLSLIGDQNFYQEAYILENLKSTLSNLKKREENLDIKISDFIERNLQTERLFHTFNHPGKRIIGLIFDLILEKANIFSEKDFLNTFAHTDALAQSYFPIYPSTREILGIRFDFQAHYQIDNQKYDKREMTKRYYDFYKTQNHNISIYLKNTKLRT